MSSASDSYGSYLWDSAYNSSFCLDVEQSHKHVFIGLLQLSGADGSRPVPRILPTQPGAQESQTGEMYLWCNLVHFTTSQIILRLYRVLILCICSILTMKIYGAVSSFSQSVITQLGGVALDLSVEELSSLRLAERRSIAAMGAVSAWSNRQVSHIFTILTASTTKHIWSNFSWDKNLYNLSIFTYHIKSILISRQMSVHF